MSYDLNIVRRRFDEAAKRKKFSKQSYDRYRSWIRRFIRFCRSLGIPLEVESAISFLGGYESRIAAFTELPTHSHEFWARKI